MSGMIDVDRLLFGKQAQQTSSHDGNNQQVDGPMLNENIALLTRQWRNEVHAPEILPYRQDLMDDVIEILKTQIVRGYIISVTINNLVFVPLLLVLCIVCCSYMHILSPFYCSKTLIR